LATSETAGLDLFLTMSWIWRKRVPPALVHESPRTLMLILELGLAPPGISHSTMRSQLGLNQPEMSKIAKKLADRGLIQVARLEADRRVKLITATDVGRNLLSCLKTDLNMSLSDIAPAKAPSQQPKPSRPKPRRGSKLQPVGQTSFKVDDYLPPDEETEVKQS
jgi:DNA-binding MarR family transcriptional regulator